EPADDGTGDNPRQAGGAPRPRRFRFLAMDRMQTRLHRWRFNLVTGQTREEQLSDSITEFGMINSGYAGREYRYTYAATGTPGWFLFDGLVRHDLETGTEERFAFGDGVFGSETAMAPRSYVAAGAAPRSPVAAGAAPRSYVAAGAAPRSGGAAEDDGYLVTLTTDMAADASYCLVFDAARVSDGPVCTLLLPERISSGTHSTWAPGSGLRRWRDTDNAAAAIGL
ncbi:MAG TPA: carotenoid oxygenase family protein, partial [Mycobacterium sp.]|nr:carotenoid oxygenase family protein [Mycobacterium sp.]